MLRLLLPEDALSELLYFTPTTPRNLGFILHIGHSSDCCPMMHRTHKLSHLSVSVPQGRAFGFILGSVPRTNVHIPAMA